MAKNLKDIVKTNPVPAKGRFGVDPTDPWSTKANINEDSSLNQYLLSRGINPKFISTETKISHAKSSAFLKWKQNHQFEGVEILEATDIKEEDPCWTGYTQVGMKKKNGREVPNCVPAKGVEKAKGYKEEVKEAKTIQGTALDKFRQSAAERAKKHDDIEREMKARHAAGKEDMKGSIDRLEKHLNKEETGVSKSVETKFHKKLDKLVHSTFGKRKDEMKMKEEVDLKEKEYPQGHPLHRSDPSLYKKTFKSVTKNYATHTGKYFSNTDIANYKTTDKDAPRYRNEDVFQDPQAATQTVFDGGNNTNDTSERQMQLSKSARMIKSLYKHLNMKEDTYDWEKADKSVQTYGKKPKLKEPAEKTNFGERVPSARVVMSGGTTLTGETRDTVEIDPEMKKRPGPDTFGPTGKKASQQ